MTALAWAVPFLTLAGCAAWAWSARRRPHDRPTRPLTLRERAQWRHITRAYSPEPGGVRVWLGQDGPPDEDPR